MDESKTNFISEDVEESLPLTKKIKLDVIAEKTETVNAIEIPEKTVREENIQKRFKPLVDVYQNVVDEVNDWACRILDAESLLQRATSFSYAINTSIHRLEIDGFLSFLEANELRYIANIWMQILQLLSNYNGDYIVKMRIMKLMLVLYDLKELNAQRLIDYFISL